MFITCWAEPFPNEVPDMTKYNQNQVADICRQENVIWGIPGDMGCQGCTELMLTSSPVLFLCTVAEFRMHRGEDLLRRGWAGRQKQTILV